MPTLTFRNDPTCRAGVAAAVARFRKRLVRHGVSGPYAWVIERGKEGRLHVHYGCNWWQEFGAVEVCDKCAVPGLRKVRFDIPPAGSFCIGCLWGQGFVGAPDQVSSDPRACAIYVSKYAAQDLGLEASPGKNRYHVARGFQPPVERRGAYTFETAVRLLGRSMDVGQAVVTAMHEQEDFEWHGPPLWSFRWD